MISKIQHELKLQPNILLSIGSQDDSLHRDIELILHESKLI